MKATFDFDDVLYRRLKVEAARRGQTIRELVALGVRYIVDAPERSETNADATADTAWYSASRHYAPNANGAHDLESMRASVANARTRTLT